MAESGLNPDSLVPAELTVSHYVIFIEISHTEAMEGFVWFVFG